MPGRIIFVFLFIFAALCAAWPSLTNVTVKTNKSGYIYVVYESSFWAMNMLEEKPKQSFIAVLPPSYSSNTARRYPVIYYLHGFQGNSMELINPIFLSRFSNYYAANPDKEMIFIAVNGMNRLYGTFYVDSPVGSFWESMFLKDIIPLADSLFRTKAKAESRGIMGGSMGGFGALNLAFRHPDVFKAAYGCIPGIFEPKTGLKKAFLQWDKVFKSAYGSAFSWNTNLPSPFAEIPVFDGSKEDNRIVSNWENGFGNWEGKIADYLKRKERLSGVAIEYGKTDPYTWIPEGSVWLSAFLTKKGITNELHSFNGGHTILPESMDGLILPFFGRHLK